MKRTFTLLTCVLLSASAFAQSISFTNQTGLLPTTTYSSGNAVGVCDMNGDKKDDIVRSDNTTMSICTQQLPNQPLTEQTHTYNLSSPWGMCVADVNNDGYNDALWGDNGATRMMYWNGTGYTGQNVSTVTGSGSIFVQGCNYFDVNNDGNIDAFVCNDVAMSHIYLGDGNLGWTFNQSLMPLATVPASDNSGNYASVWSDINNDGYCDLMITHCRQGVSNSSDPRRIDQVFINNGNGTYTQDTTNWTGLRDGAQGWSTAWGDIDNDGDMDGFVLNYDVNSTLMINDGNGVFTNMISGSGISNTTSFFGMNATFQDFDNDTYLDLMLTGDDHFLYKGNGDGTFTLVSPNPFPYSTYTITSHAVGDLNYDGFLDVYGSYCDVYNSPDGTRRDRLWMNDCPNDGNTNHYIVLDLVGGAPLSGMSNRNGIGAIVKIYGPWGVQVREIRSGEAYGIQNSFAAHFGLGSATAVDSVIIQWPSGVTDQLMTLPADNHYTIPEGGFPTSAHAPAAKPVDVKVIPNPVNGNGVIALSNFQDHGLENLSLNIYDVSGKAVYTENNLSRSIIPVNSEMLSKGIYFFELRAGNERVKSGKFIVE